MSLRRRTPPRLGSARAARTYLIVSLVICSLYALDVFGEWGGVAFTATSVLALVVGAIGLRHYHPEPSRAWHLLPIIGGLFVAGNVVRAATGQNASLNNATIAPDLLTLPGYALFALMLLRLIRARQAGQSDGVLLDAMMFGFGTLIVFYVYLIAPVIRDGGLGDIARWTFSVYPPASASLALLAARLAFMPGKRSEPLVYFLAGMLSLFTGDVVYFLAESGTATAPLNLIDLPYSVAFTFVAAALFHPDITKVTATSVRQGPAMQDMRAAIIGFALLLPCLLLLTWQPESPSERRLLGAVTMLLTALGVARLLVATRAQARSEHRYAHRATHDALTDLPNRELLLETVDAALHSSIRRDGVAVILLDIDRFKLANDTLGHVAGDQLLLQCGARVQEVVGARGIVGRISGDEFVVVIPDATEEYAQELSEDLRRAFESPLYADRDIFLTISIGIAHTTEQLSDPADLLREADTAMYRSKEGGRNRVTSFHRAMLETDERRITLEHALRNAIGAGELDVFYQPIVCLRTGRVKGFEALARWQTANGWIPPSEFVPVAEDSGLIEQLGAWILRESARQLSRWRAQPAFIDATMSVNLSVRQMHANLPELIDHTLQAAGIPGEALWLEITESMMLNDTTEMQTILEAVRALGVQFSIDDFGTGFSSLSYLRRYPIDRLKIDRSFVSGLSPATTSGSLADAMVAIGRSLSMSTVAEGVENIEETNAMRGIGCDFAQGYYFARPMPASDIPLSLPRIEQAWHELGEPLPRETSGRSAR